MAVFGDNGSGENGHGAGRWNKTRAHPQRLYNDRHYGAYRAPKGTGFEDQNGCDGDNTMSAPSEFGVNLKMNRFSTLLIDCSFCALF